MEAIEPLLNMFYRFKGFFILISFCNGPGTWKLLSGHPGIEECLTMHEKRLVVP